MNANKKKTILIVGATGMLGSALISELSKNKKFDVFGTVRCFEEAKRFLPAKIISKIRADVEAEDSNSLTRVISSVKPAIIVNCIGFVRQPQTETDVASAISLNALFPHRLAHISRATGSRLIHISTDAVFSGQKGGYTESDIPDAEDIYGRTKLLGEISQPHCLTLRTSIIGHGLENHTSLVDWFLTQNGKVKGFRKVIYSGLPVVEIARILTEYIIPNEKLSGLYHVSSQPISKYDLLSLISKIYGKKVAIKECDDMILNRSLDSSRFQKITSYRPPTWEQLVRKMYRYYRSNPNFVKY